MAVTHHAVAPIRQFEILPQDPRPCIGGEHDAEREALGLDDALKLRPVVDDASRL
jgi:hypothetical protein